MSKIVFESDDVILMESEENGGAVYYMIKKSTCIKVDKEGFDKIIGYEDPANKIAAFCAEHQTASAVSDVIDLDIFVYHKGCEGYEDKYKNILLPALMWYEKEILGRDIPYILGSDVLAQMFSKCVVEVKNKETDENIAVCGVTEIPNSGNTLGVDCVFCNKEMYNTDWQVVMVEVLIAVVNNLKKEFAGKDLLVSETKGCLDIEVIASKLKSLEYSVVLEDCLGEKCIRIK